LKVETLENQKRACTVADDDHDAYATSY